MGVTIKQVDLDLGILVREYRQEKGLTQLDLARRLGFDSPQFISLFERGLSKIPLNVLGKLITILGIPEKKIMKSLLKSYEVTLRQEISAGKRNAG